MADVVPEDDGVLFFEPFHVTGWLTARGVDGILLVDGPDGDLVVVLSGDRFGRADRVGERDFDPGHNGVVPGSGDGGFGTVRGLGRSGYAEVHKCENHHKCAVVELQGNTPLVSTGGS